MIGSSGAGADVRGDWENRAFGAVQRIEWWREGQRVRSMINYWERKAIRGSGCEAGILMQSGE